MKGDYTRMKIQCKKADLLNGVNIVLKAIPVKSTMPILGCIVIEAGNQYIKLIANDMELGIETLVKGTVSEPGTVALDAKIFSEIIRRLPSVKRQTSRFPENQVKNFLTFRRLKKKMQLYYHNLH